MTALIYWKKNITNKELYIQWKYPFRNEAKWIYLRHKKTDLPQEEPIKDELQVEGKWFQLKEYLSAGRSEECRGIFGKCKDVL